MTGGVGQTVMVGVTAAAGNSMCRALVGGCWDPRIPQPEAWASLLEPGQNSSPSVFVVADQLVSLLLPIYPPQLQVSAANMCNLRGRDVIFNLLYIAYFYDEVYCKKFKIYCVNFFTF